MYVSKRIIERATWYLEMWLQNVAFQVPITLLDYLFALFIKTSILSIKASLAENFNEIFTTELHKWYKRVHDDASLMIITFKGIN